MARGIIFRRIAGRIVALKVPAAVKTVSAAIGATAGVALGAQAVRHGVNKKFSKNLSTEKSRVIFDTGLDVGTAVVTTVGLGILENKSRNVAKGFTVLKNIFKKRR